jgi:AAA+ superfamily predicted ATPase
VPPDDDTRGSAQAPLVAVLKYIVHGCHDDAIFLLKDVHQYFAGVGTYNPVVTLSIRALRDAFYELRETGQPKKIVLLAPEPVIPPDLEKELHLEDFPLPTRGDLQVAITTYLRRATAIHQKDREFVYEVRDPQALAAALVNAAVGLTAIEVEYIFENMLYAEHRLTDEAPARVMREKQQIIRKSGALQFIPAGELSHLRVGGLERLREWLRLRQRVFDDADRARKEYGIDRVPRGVLLVGISGCGKSLTCKSIAHEWGYPLLRMDMGAIFDKWVGSSEERIRRALRVAESIAPCVLWVDEIEKGFSVGAGGDGGTSARVLSTFLVWMQEKRAPVFVAATANDLSQLPPELLRPGRFDNRFFVGCPGDRSRAEIFRIHLAARRLDPSAFDLESLVARTVGFTGAEIEQVVLDSAYDAFSEDRRAAQDDLLRNLARTRPLVHSLAPQLERVWALLDQGRMELASDDTLTSQQIRQVMGLASMT